MYNFEDDPLRQVYDDLAYGKSDSHFDQVLKLKGTLRDSFAGAMRPCRMRFDNDIRSQEMYRSYSKIWP